MNGNSLPLISIIIAVFNGDKTLQQCIDSITRQKYEYKELIIIDGGSIDGTVNLLEANQRDVKYWISEPDRGIYNAWNKGLSQVRGEWVVFLGADDFFWDENVLGLMISQLVFIPSNILLAYGQIMLLNNNGESLYTVGEPWEKIRSRFQQVMCIPHPGAMHRRNLFEQSARFDESFRIAGDYEFLLRELKTGDAVFIPNLIVTGMRQGGISSDPANALVAMWETRRAQKMHGQHLPGWIWMIAIARVYGRLLLWYILGERMTRRALDLYRRMVGLPSYWTRT